MSSSEPVEAIGELYRAHVEERPFWASVAARLGEELQASLTFRRIGAKVDWRAKTTGSVIGKAYRKPERYQTTGDFGDLAGVRILVPFSDEVSDAAEVVRNHPELTVTDDDDKKPPPDALAYAARHLQVAVSTDLAGERPDGIADSRSISCEVQIQTFSQNLWANVSHLVSYKRDLPPDVQRRVNRLVALSEIFDDEAKEARDRALAAADDIERVAGELTRYWTAISGESPGQPGRVAQFVARLQAALGDDASRYPEILETFLTKRSDRLQLILRDEAGRVPFTDGPEGLFLLERLDNARASLGRAWEDHYPPALLEKVEDAWGPDLT